MQTGNTIHPTKKFHASCAAVAMIALMSFSSAAFAQPSEQNSALSREKFKGGSQVLAAFSDVVKRASLSTAVVVADGKPAALGTVVDRNGFILTKASQIGQAKRLSCKLPGGREIEATLHSADFDNDIAMLRVPARNLIPVEWSSQKVGVGSWVATPGNAGKAVSVGVLSVQTRRIPRVPPVLGVNIAEHETGPRVAQVFPNSGAAKAGLRVNDIILDAAGRKTLSREDLIDILGRQQAGDHVAIGIRRGDEQLKFKVLLSPRQQVFPMNPRASVQNAMGGILSTRRDGFPSVIQHDTVLQPNQCGGPIVDLTGKAIGINIARAGRVKSYAVPVSVIRPLITKLKSAKSAKSAK